MLNCSASFLPRAGALGLAALLCLAAGCPAPPGDVADADADPPDAAPLCGNAVVEGFEECDDGSDLSDLRPNACRSDCRLPRCGDGVTDTGEDCDEGPSNSDEVPNLCRTSCRLPSCGDGTRDSGGGESCDDGNTVGSDGCGATCQWEFCGSGLVDLGERCDDGNAIAGDGCSPDCRSVEVCGNGIADFAAGETCDCGTMISELPPGCVAINGDASGLCAVECSSTICGNGLVDAVRGEICDDGNQQAGDGCSPDCLSDETCGNGRADFAAGEDCDCGADATSLPTHCPAANGATGSPCSTQCHFRVCGDGVVDPDRGEVCDDGNHEPLDGCSPNCLSDEECGNGYVDVILGELCDDGNPVGGGDDDCDVNCTLPSCGNGVEDEGETCDDGNRIDGDGCNARCSSWETCGNGITDFGAGETCDDGLGAASVTCSASCLFMYCGNGRLEPRAGEVCDDGNTDAGDGCAADCQSEEICGDGVLDLLANEQCDDGSMLALDGCSPDCLIEAGWSCQGSPSICLSLCGDGMLVGDELCDGNNLNGETCQSLVAGSGTVVCRPDCTGFDVSGCVACGDGAVTGGEVCDDGNNLPCDGCAADCSRVDNQCGDGVWECGESCEDGNTDAADGVSDFCAADCASHFWPCGLWPGVVDPSHSSCRFTFHSVMVNGSTSGYAAVGFGQSFGVTATLNYQHCGYCPGCVMQGYLGLRAGLPPAFDDGVTAGCHLAFQHCDSSLGFGDNLLNTSFQAPTQPGTYYLRWNTDEDLSCVGWGCPDSNHNLTAICVQ